MTRVYETALSFLRAVLPAQPRYVGAIQRHGKKGLWQNFFDTIEALAHWQIKEDAPGKEVYFALGAFGDVDSREAANVHTLKSFWLDMDCGEGKSYPTRDDAIAALNAFCTRGFPDYSYLVKSGHGVHAYWVLDRELPKAQWQIVANAFQSAWQSFGLKGDPVSADAARVLRCPGTHNHKFGGSAAVEILDTTGEVHRVEVIQHASMQFAPVKPAASALGALESNDDLLANLPQRKAYIQPIAQQCRQVATVAANKGQHCSEPLWYAVIQLSRHLENGREVAHFLSSGHADYNPASVDDKLAQLEAKDIGPTTCAKFKSLNPSLCEGCKWNITSPIQLGEKAPEPAPSVIVRQVADTNEAGETEVRTEELAAPVPMPKGFMQTAEGAAAQVFDEKGIPSWKVIFPGVIFPMRIFRAPGRPLEMEVYTCLNGTGEVKEFKMPVTRLGEARETKNELLQNVMIDSQNGAMLQKLLNGMGLSIQHQSRTGRSVRQFGWQLGDPEVRQHFVYGTTRFSPAGVERGIPIDGSLELPSQLCHNAGSLAGAVEGASLFNRPGAQMHQAVYLTGLVGVFAPFTGAQNFAVLSLVSRVGGEGKTTNCDAAMSHWFNPILVRSSPRDTQNATYNTMSVRGTLPVFIDEVTNTKPELAVELIYTASQGREKARMESSGAKQREPLPPWKCPILVTSNMSIKQLVRANRGDASALDARVVEMQYSRLDLTPPERVAIGRLFYENFGWTGPAVAHHVATNFDNYGKAAEIVRAKLLEALGWDGADRFWLNWGVGVLLACRAMNALKLTSYDFNQLFGYVTWLILQQRTQKEADLRTASDILAEFLAENSGRIIVGYKSNGREGATRLVTLGEPQRVAALVGRSQLDEQVLYVAISALRDFCTSRGYDYRSFVGEAASERLTATTRVVDTKPDGKPVWDAVPPTYSLGRGTPLASAPTKIVAFSLNHIALRDHMNDARSAAALSQSIKVTYADVQKP